MNLPADGSPVTRLRMPRGYPVVILHPPAYYLSQLSDIPQNLLMVDELVVAPFIQWFVSNPRQLHAALPTVLRALADDGWLWICWPTHPSQATNHNRYARSQPAMTQQMVTEAVVRAKLRPAEVLELDLSWLALPATRSAAD